MTHRTVFERQPRKNRDDFFPLARFTFLSSLETVQGPGSGLLQALIQISRKESMIMARYSGVIEINPLSANDLIKSNS